MYTVTILFKNSQQNLQLIFDKFDDAKQTANALMPPTKDVDGFIATDDYGHTIFIKLDNILSMLVEDVEQGLRGVEAIQLMRARAQAKLQQKAQNDPMLKLMSAGVPSTMVQ